MINDLQEVQWAYLLDPAFELVNTAGKPLTDGYIEVYIHGTRNKYYCASDFDGTLHPFKIPLDALGANIVLASPAHSYDVYVYNKFGSLVMSRYNVQPKTGSGEIVHDDITVSSNDGSVQIVTSGQTNYDLSIQDTVDRVDVVESSITNLATSIEEITNVVTAHDVDIEELKANKKDKQEEYVAIGGPTKTITKVEQDEDGKMTVTYEDIDLPQEVPNVEITSPNGTINIASSIDVATNTKTFEIDVDGHEPDWHYWTGNNAWTTLTNGTWKDINRPTVGAGKAPHSWTPEVKLGVYDAKADFTVTFHNPNNSYTVPNQIIQIGFRAKLVGKHNADAIRYVDLGAWTYDPSLYTTEQYQFNFAQESLRQNYSTSKILYVPAYVGDTEFYIYYQAALLNTDGSQNVTAIDPVCRAEITYFGYHEVVGSITGTASGGTTLYAGSGIDIDEDRINVNIGEGLTIVNNNVSIDKSVVLAKDNLVAGDNITITASGDNLIINSTGGGATYTAGDGIDITNDVISVDNSIARTSDLEAYIPYSASGVVLPNSHFEIGVDGQAYKLSEESGTKSPTFINNWLAYGDVAVTKLETGVTYTLTVQGAYKYNIVEFYNYLTGSQYSNLDGEGHHYYLFDDNGVCTFTWKLETAIVAMTVPGTSLSADNTTLTYTKAVKERYILESELASAIPDISNFVTNVELASAIDAVEAEIPDVSEFATKTDLEAYIPYSASGVELPNSNFEIGVDGQAYKTNIDRGTNALSFERIEPHDYDSVVTQFETGVTYTMTVQGANVEPRMTNYYDESVSYAPKPSFNLRFDNGVCTFTWPYETATVATYVHRINCSADNTTVTYDKSSKERYILESELASAIPDVSNFVTNSDLASAINVIEAEIPDTSTLATKTELGSAIDELQDEINNIPAQVQANWNESNQSSKAYIQNKPSIPTKTSDLQNDSGFATTTDLEAYIPYSASGVELPNSNFEIGVDGQAYKTGVETIAKSPTFINYGGNNVALTKLETGVTYTLTVQGAYQWSSPVIYNHNSGTAYTIRDMFDANGVCVFTWPYETAIVRIYVAGVSMNASNTTLTYVKASKERYILESELASAIPEVTTYVAGQGITFTASGDDVVISSTGGGAAYTAGDGIDITNDVISVDNSIARASDLDNLATKTELGSAIDELQSEINDIPAQVQSDWTEADTSSKAYIQNKPVEKVLIAGNNVSITDIGSAIEISSTGGSGSQVQADWTEDDSSDPSYIQNKPTEKNLVAGTNVTITETNDDVIVNTTEIASGAELVAGSGINIEEVGNTIRISNDETVLWVNSTGATSFTASEALTHFDTVKFYISSHANATISVVEVPMLGNNLTNIVLAWNDYWQSNNAFHVMQWQSKLNNTNMTSFSIDATYYMGTNSANAQDNGTYTDGAPIFYKVVGINRISN